MCWCIFITSHRFISPHLNAFDSRKHCSETQTPRWQLKYPQPYSEGRRLTAISCVCNKVSELCSYIGRHSFTWICKALRLPSCQKLEWSSTGTAQPAAIVEIWANASESTRDLFFIPRRVLSCLQMERSKKFCYLLHSCSKAAVSLLCPFLFLT